MTEMDLFVECHCHVSCKPVTLIDTAYQLHCCTTIEAYNQFIRLHMYETKYGTTRNRNMPGMITTKISHRTHRTQGHKVLAKLVEVNMFTN